MPYGYAGGPAVYDTDFYFTSQDLVVTTSIPEFPSVVAPVAAILVLLLIFGRKKG